LKEGRLLFEGTGDNLSTDLNFIPKMDPRKLIEGYQSILKRIYDCDAYYDRVREFLKHYQPTFHMKHTLSDYTALLRSMVKQGLLGHTRSSYWKFFFDAATRYRYAFGTAITLAIMGYHFQIVTEQVLQSE
jgi:hypothetical protein